MLSYYNSCLMNKKTCPAVAEYNFWVGHQEKKTNNPEYVFVLTKENNDYYSSLLNTNFFFLFGAPDGPFRPS